MAQGFGELQNKSAAARFKAGVTEGGFDTLFERVKKEAGGEKKSLTWYRATTQRLGKQYKANFDKFLRDEKRDSIDETINADSNELRRWAVQGHMYLFEYPDPESRKKLKYWDTYPLVYVMRSNKEEFWGFNLHYIATKKRIVAASKLAQGRVDMPKSCLHKYLHKHVDQQLYLDVAINEWDTVVLLPIENFVRDLGGVKFPIRREDVWEDTDENFYDKFKATRKVKGYGTTQSIEMVK
tara:strand:+ start:1217 stop:1933 length:717 start_codon:yes stop_codon:yes gene_type:complete